MLGQIFYRLHIALGMHVRSILLFRRSSYRPPSSLNLNLELELRWGFLAEIDRDYCYSCSTLQYPHCAVVCLEEHLPQEDMIDRPKSRTVHQVRPDPSKKHNSPSTGTSGNAGGDFDLHLRRVDCAFLKDMPGLMQALRISTERSYPLRIH